MPSPTVRIMRGTNVYDERQIPEGSTVSLFTDTVEGVDIYTVWISVPEHEADAVGTPDLTTAGEISVGAGDVEAPVTEIPAPPEPPPPVEPEPEPAPEPELPPEPEP